jgi:hypothetical protein
VRNTREGVKRLLIATVVVAEVVVFLIFVPDLTSVHQHIRDRVMTPWLIWSCGVLIVGFAIWYGGNWIVRGFAGHTDVRRHGND